MLPSNDKLHNSDPIHGKDNITWNNPHFGVSYIRTDGLVTNRGIVSATMRYD